MKKLRDKVRSYAHSSFLTARGMGSLSRFLKFLTPPLSTRIFTELFASQYSVDTSLQEVIIVIISQLLPVVAF